MNDEITLEIILDEVSYWNQILGHDLAHLEKTLQDKRSHKDILDFIITDFNRIVIWQSALIRMRQGL